MLQTTATDHCCFCTPQKEMAKDDRSIPNETGASRTAWTCCGTTAYTGKLTPSQFVAVRDNTARIFNIWPKKGAAAGADADIVVWDPNKTRTISTETHHQNIDFLLRGHGDHGRPRSPSLRGGVVWRDDQLFTERGTGRYMSARPSPSTGTPRGLALAEPTKVDRA